MTHTGAGAGSEKVSHVNEKGKKKKKGERGFEQRLTGEFAHLPAKQNLSLYALILNSIPIQVLKDDDITSGSLRGLSLSRARRRLRRRF